LTLDRPNQTDLLRWWHQYQAQLLNQEADRIRNSFLQEMFAVRRRFELACQSPACDKPLDCVAHLADLKRLYTLLETLSDRLDSPYLQDSLPLAIQHAVEPWKSQVPLRLDLPGEWVADPVEHNRLLLLLIDALLQQLAIAHSPASRCDLQLHCEHGVKTLVIQVSDATQVAADTAQAIAHSLEPFLETFHLFTHGNIHHTVLPQSLCWQLSWQSPVRDPMSPAHPSLPPSL